MPLPFEIARAKQLAGNIAGDIFSLTIGGDDCGNIRAILSPLGSAIIRALRDACNRELADRGLSTIDES